MQDIYNKLAELVNLLDTTLHELQRITETLESINNKLN